MPDRTPGLFDAEPFSTRDGLTITTAILSECETYRYDLTRRWDDDRLTLGWVMLNPSTADEHDDDPTIRRCIGFAKKWGYGSIKVANLYALRSTAPANLWTHPDPVGPDNDRYLAHIVFDCPLTVLAWGAHATRPARVSHVVRNLADAAGEADHQLAVLGWSKQHAPRHPLYMRGDTSPEILSLDSEVFG